MEAHIRRLSYIVSLFLILQTKTSLYSSTTARSEHDQELDSLLVGPIPVGVNKFIFEADSPKTDRIPGTDILGVTVILLSCSYDEREFVRVGYYVNNEYMDASMNEDPPAKPEIEKIRRNILADKPRVTRFQIKWDSEESAPSEFPPEQPDVDNQEDDEAAYGAEEEQEEEEEGAAPAEGEALATAKVPGEDADMEGVENENGKDDDEESNAGSEVDLEAESEDDEEDDEEGEEEAEGDDMEMDDAPQDAASHANAKNGSTISQPHPQSEMMVH